ncbi:MAG: hypothetical protein JOZ16_09510 [Methylobacteriaceae bacterium]|nr:hypothetical protein [Methylobacteriaceae bacterium]
MHDYEWTVQNVNELTRRAFEVLAARIGLDRAEFLQLLLVEYATNNVLNTNAMRARTASEPSPGKENSKRGSQRVRLKPVADDEIETDGPTAEQIVDWMRRLDAVKPKKTVLHLSNSLLKSWLASPHPPIARNQSLASA